MNQYPFLKSLEWAKPFSTFDKKSIWTVTRQQVIRGAWVDHEYVWATDSQILARIPHDVPEVLEPYIHAYSSDDEEYFSTRNVEYPSVSRLIHPMNHTKCRFTITDIPTWIRSHELAAIVSPTASIRFSLDPPTIRATYTKKELYEGNAKFRSVDLPLIDLYHSMDGSICYNVAYMITALQLFNKANVLSVEVLMNTKVESFMLRGGDIVVMICPIRFEMPEPQKGEMSNAKPIHA